MRQNRLGTVFWALEVATRPGGGKSSGEGGGGAGGKGDGKSYTDAAQIAKLQKQNDQLLKAKAMSELALAKKDVELAALPAKAGRATTAEEAEVMAAIST